MRHTPPGEYDKHRTELHENSTAHRESVLTLSQRISTKVRIDSALVSQYEAQCAFTRALLERLIATIMFLTERGLAFRGQDELFGSKMNGNYMGTLELIARFDPFLSTHIEKCGGQGRGSVSYLSSTVC